jgi:hypothetical protein
VSTRAILEEYDLVILGGGTGTGLDRFRVDDIIWMFNPKILGAPATRSAFASVPCTDGLRVNTEGQVKR